MSDPLNNSYCQTTANYWETRYSFVSAAEFDVALIGVVSTGFSASLACADCFGVH
jgi:hypothetical protein